MQQRRNFRFLSKAALVCSLLCSAGCSSVFGDRTPPAVPQAREPCSLPYAEHARALPPQQNIDKPLPGDGLSDLYSADVGAYNQLYPRFNANIDWVAGHCDRRPGTAPPQ